MRVWASIISSVAIHLFVVAPGEGRAADPSVVMRERAMMGTQVIVKVYGVPSKELDEVVEAAFDEIGRLERLMSNFIAESPLSSINDKAGGPPVNVPEELFDIIKDAVHYSELSDGAFDISFASVGQLWDFRRGILPSGDQIREKLPLVDYGSIELDGAKKTVRLPKEGMKIGLGGIGKGIAVDRAMAVLKSKGYGDVMIMAGGDTAVRGRKGDEPWKIGLRDPRTEDRIMAVIPMEEGGISTSGDYERFFIKDGVRYHHILDPETGFPAEKSRSVTILAPDASTSDPLSTAVFVLGPDEGMALVEKLEDVEAIIVDASGKVHLSSGLVGSGIK